MPISTIQINDKDNFDTNKINDLFNVITLYSNDEVGLDDVMNTIAGIENDDAINILIRIVLYPTSERMQIMAVRALVEIAIDRSQSAFHDRLLPVFCSLLSNGNKLIRKYSSQALENISSPAGVDTLIDAFHNEIYTDVRISIIRALARTGDPRAADFLINLVNHKNFDIQSTAIIELGNFSNPQVIQTLKNVWSSYNVPLRELAKQALLNIDPNMLITNFLTFVNKETNTSRIEKIKIKLFQIIKAFGERAVKPLINIITHPREETEQKMAAEGLESLGSRAVPSILDEFSKYDRIKDIYISEGREYNWDKKYKSIIEKYREIILGIGGKAIPVLVSSYAAKMLPSSELELAKKKINDLLLKANANLPWNDFTTGDAILDNIRTADLLSDVVPDGIGNTLLASNDEEPQVSQADDRDIQVEFPDTVALGKTYDLTISILLPESGINIQETISVEVGLNLTIEVSAPDFEIIEGTARCSIVIEPDNQKVVFKLKPLDAGSKYIRISFIQKAYFLGAVDLFCHVTQA